MTYDIVNGLEAKPRLQIDHQKVCVFWDTNLGASEEALVDAYIAAHGLNTALKYGVDLSLSGYTDRLELWDLWLSDVADFIETNQIQAICCSPNCPLTQDFIYPGISSGAAFSSLLASSVSVKAMLNSQVTLDQLLSSKFIEQGIKNLTVKTMDNQEDVYYLQNGGLLRDDLPVNDSGFNIGGIESDDFKYSNYKIAQLWSTDFDSVKGRTGIEPRNPHNGAEILKLPSWRIGWKASGNMPSPTAQEITNMVNRGKAAGAISFDDHKTQSRIAMTLRDRTSNGHCGKGVAIGKVLEEIGYTNYNYGFRTTHSNTLANITAVDDSSLAHFKKLNPISNQTDSRFVSTNTPVLDAEPNPVNSSTIRYYDDAAVSAGQKGMRFDAYNGATFPVECFIHFSLFGNFNTNNNLEFYNTASPSSQTIKVKDGGCVIELTSHGHKISPMALRHGASAAFCSYSEPSGTSSVMKAERFLFSLLRGNSYAIAASRNFDDWMNPVELWGDGLATPYSEQSNEITPENKTMNNVKFELIAAPSYTMFLLGSLPAITTAGTGHSIDDIITLNGNGVGSGIKIHVLGVDGSGGVTGYKWHSGGLGFANLEVATQANTTGSGINTVLTLGAIETTNDVVGFGFFSDPLTQTVAAQGPAYASLYNSAGVEFAFSQFNPDIPDLHALVSAPSPNGFNRNANMAIWVEGDLNKWPYGDNVIVYINGVGYPFKEEWIGNGAATWSNSAASVQPGYSRLEWFTAQGPVAERGPVAFEGDRIGMSLTVPEQQPKRLVRRGY